MKILSTKYLIFISRALVLKATDKSLASTDVFPLKWITFLWILQPDLSNSCLLSLPFLPTSWHTYTHTGLGEYKAILHYGQSFTWQCLFACVLCSQMTSRAVPSKGQAWFSFFRRGRSWRSNSLGSWQPTGGPREGGPFLSVALQWRGLPFPHYLWTWSRVLFCHIMACDRIEALDMLHALPWPLPALLWTAGRSDSRKLLPRKPRSKSVPADACLSSWQMKKATVASHSNSGHG